MEDRRDAIPRAGIMLTVTEVFTSIEGETSFIGTPMTFVRLTGCHLRCVWCDTDHAFHGGEARDVASVVREVASRGAAAACVTGGEPLLQPDCPALVSALCDLGKPVLVETSGSRPTDLVDDRAITILDLKAPGSGEAPSTLWENLDRLRPRDEIKVVLADRRDYEWARDVVRRRGLGERHHVFLNTAWGLLPPADLAAWILEDGLPVRLGVQLHKYLWGADARGR